MINLPFEPDYTAHPGELAAMFMEDIGIDSAELARRMDVAIQVVERLLSAEEEFIVEPLLAEKLGMAFGMPAQFWRNAEALYREDLIRLTPKRVGLFDEWESFRKVEGKEGASLATRIMEDILFKGDERQVRAAKAVHEAGHYIVLVERYKGRLFFVLSIGSGRGTCVAIGPNLLRPIERDKRAAAKKTVHGVYVAKKRRGIAAGMARWLTSVTREIRSGQERPSFAGTYVAA